MSEEDYSAYQSAQKWRVEATEATESRDFGVAVGRPHFLSLAHRKHLAGASPAEITRLFVIPSVSGFN